MTDRVGVKTSPWDSYLNPPDDMDGEAECMQEVSH